MLQLSELELHAMRFIADGALPAGGAGAVDAPVPRKKRGVAVSVQSLVKRYGNREVLRNVDLKIEPGQLVAIVGRSGCGKSTLLRQVAALERAEQGTIQLDGVPLTALHPGVRIMYQDARLLPWRRVLANVALGLGKGEHAAARAVLAQVGLGERANDWPAVLSGGQRQRVALARALVHDPQLLLLDEPLGALDALTRIEMQQLIEDLWRRRGFTALLVTHDVDEAVALADRVVLIEAGEIALDLTIDLPRPRSRGSAAFAQLVDRVLQRVLQQLASENHVAPAVTEPYITDIHAVRFAI